MPFDPTPITPLTVEQLLATPEHFKRWLDSKPLDDYAGLCFQGDRCLMHSFVFESTGENLHFGRYGYAPAPLPLHTVEMPYKLPAWAARFIGKLDDEMRDGVGSEVPTRTALRILSSVTADPQR